MPDGGERARARLRLVSAVLLFAGALTLIAVLAAPDPDPSDHGALIACAVAYAVLGLALVFWRTPPDAVLRGLCPLGTLCATAALVVAEPIGLIPVYYLWPMLVAAYFLDRREVVANLVFALVACGATLLLWVDPVLRLASFLAVASILVLSLGVVVVLREQVLALVTRLRTLASQDSLTGALNRGAFEQRLDAELSRTRRTEAPLALVVFDVDHFKAINDSFGHAAGDAALRAIGHEVAGAMRCSDVFGRLGGEEFGLVLPDTDIAGAAVVADKLRRRLSRAAEFTVSFGVAQSAGDRSPLAMLDEADRALYAAKHAGRDRVVRSDQIPARVAAPWPRAAF